MVDLLGRQDRGVPAGARIQSTTLVPCLHNNGDLTTLHAAAELYYQPVCHPQLAPLVSGGCPYQKDCLDLHMGQLYGETGDHPLALGEEISHPKKAASSLVEEAFAGLPTDNQTLHPE